MLDLEKRTDAYRLDSRQVVSLDSGCFATHAGLLTALFRRLHSVSFYSVLGRICLLPEILPFTTSAGSPPKNLDSAAIPWRNTDALVQKLFWDHYQTIQSSPDTPLEFALVRYSRSQVSFVSTPLTDNELAWATAKAEAMQTTTHVRGHYRNADVEMADVETWGTENRTVRGFSVRPHLRKKPARRRLMTAGSVVRGIASVRGILAHPSLCTVRVREELLQEFLDFVIVATGFLDKGLDVITSLARSRAYGSVFGPLRQRAHIREIEPGDESLGMSDESDDFGMPDGFGRVRLPPGLLAVSGQPNGIAPDPGAAAADFTAAANRAASRRAKRGRSRPGKATSKTSQPGSLPSGLSSQLMSLIRNSEHGRADPISELMATLGGDDTMFHSPGPQKTKQASRAAKKGSKPGSRVRKRTKDGPQSSSNSGASASSAASSDSSPPSAGEP